MSNQEEMYSIIGRLYIDVYSAQRYITALQEELKNKDQKILSLQQDSNKETDE